jgi:hypothetical protein
LNDNDIRDRRLRKISQLKQAIALSKAKAIAVLKFNPQDDGDRLYDG